ncbi:MAG TPA: hypothetical protein VJC07_03730 [Candidatus Nanoarchaeia archaeon]|nr:hypothetical protein [Candidatus Nanoarchaeia archaeon]
MQIQIMKQLALESLTLKQKLILEKIRLAESKTISGFVLALRRELDCADSTLWKSIKDLRSRKLLEESSLSLTETAKFLIEQDV